VHQDGLVHVSALSDKFVKDPHTVVKAGDVVKVKVLEVDIPRKRIALTMKLNEQVQRNVIVGARETASAGSSRNMGTAHRTSQKPRQTQQMTPEPAGAMAAAFAKLKR